jgi:hypothetical protein
MSQVFAQPVGWGSGIRRPAIRPVIAYGVGVTLGGAILGTVVALLGRLLDSVSPALTSAVGIAAIVGGLTSEILGTTRYLPQRRRQVPGRWLQWRRQSATAAAFGLEIGVGFLTLIHRGAIYVMAGCMLLVGLPGAVLAGAVFGFSKATMLGLAWLRSARAPGGASATASETQRVAVRITLSALSLVTASAVLLYG